MAIANEISFNLSRFEWTPPDRIVVAGAWFGVSESDLSSPVLVLNTPVATHRLQAVRGTSSGSRRWSAEFAWDGDPASVDRSELALGSSFVVELPSRTQARRRFGRVALPVRELEPQGTAVVASAADSDVFALHAAMVRAQDEVAEARDEAERARAAANHERVRREVDVSRLQESMNELRQMAEGALEREREKAHSQLAEVREKLAAGMNTERELNELRTELAAAQETIQLAELDKQRLESRLLAVREVIEREL